MEPRASQLFAELNINSPAQDHYSRILEAFYEYILLHFPEDHRDLSQICRIIRGLDLDGYDVSKFTCLEKGKIECSVCKEQKPRNDYIIVKCPAEKLGCIICIRCRVSSRKSAECNSCTRQYSNSELYTMSLYN